MLDLLWSGMLLIGILWGAAAGRTEALTEAVLDGAGDAVSLCIAMLGLLSLWNGFLKIAENAGLTGVLARLLAPVLDFLFPELPPDHPARGFLSTNIIANILGLGWAATPAGLAAAERLKNETSGAEETATTSFCAFLVLNVSSLQLIPVNILAYRQQYGSANPEAILAPAILATLASTAAGVLFIRVMTHFDRCRRPRGIAELSRLP